MLISENSESKAAMERMMRSPLWHSLPAVRSGRVHLVDAVKWNGPSPRYPEVEFDPKLTATGAAAAPSR